MADLSGVLRKTIDGLPKATPQLRAKVYEKARAAIQRQVASADPPLAEDVVEARMRALEDAIERTEAYYGTLNEGDAPSSAEAPASAPSAPARPTAPPVAKQSAALERPAPPPPPVDRGRMPPASNQREGDPRSSSPRQEPPRPADRLRPSQEDRGYDGDAATARNRAAGDVRHTGSQNEDQPYFPVAEDDGSDSDRPASVAAPFVTAQPHNGARTRAGSDASSSGSWNEDRLPAGIRSDDDFIPEADLSAPRYAGARRRKTSSGTARKALVAGLAIVLLAGLGTACWLYHDDIERLLIPSSNGIGKLAGNTGNSPSSGAAENAATPANPNADAKAGNAPASTAPAANGGVAPGTEPSTREFTQRLLPDGTEVDEGPAPKTSNAFDEGTNVAAASPADDGTSQQASPTVSSAINEAPEAVNGNAAGGNTPPATMPAGVAEPTPAPTKAEDGKQMPKVAQDAVFYQERTENSAGTQEKGQIVWSLVKEPPADGQPPEAAIRGVATIPGQNLKMTMTIRRNADPTLPASHVVELLFKTPGNFAGGSIANVQRLALKMTEQARGEPLIGVAGKISDGFFIIALNNLDQATKNNLALLRNQQWIDIPMAYGTGRRALLSIEKGPTGDKVFDEAMDAWRSKGG